MYIPINFILCLYLLVHALDMFTIETAKLKSTNFLMSKVLLLYCINNSRLVQLYTVYFDNEIHISSYLIFLFPE